MNEKYHHKNLQIIIISSKLNFCLRQLNEWLGTKFAGREGPSESGCPPGITNFAKSIMADSRKDFTTEWKPSRSKREAARISVPVRVRVTKTVLETGEPGRNLSGKDLGKPNEIIHWVSFLSQVGISAHLEYPLQNPLILVSLNLLKAV